MKCNLMYKIPPYIPIVFHKLSGYDPHLFMKELAALTDESIGVIAKNTEDYISFSIKVEVDRYIDENGIERLKEIELRFIDSFKFMSSSIHILTHYVFTVFEKYTKYRIMLKIVKYDLNNA